MSRTEGSPPTLDELRQAFAELLVRATAEDGLAPTQAVRHPALVDAIDNVARAWPNVTDEPIFKAHKSFARYEATRRASQ